MGCGTFGGCNGGSGTSGKGRNTYTPSKSSDPWTTGSRKGGGSVGGAKTVGKASEFGIPKVRASFSRRK